MNGVQASQPIFADPASLATATPLQQEKYRRIVAAAYELANAGGYDALQMRAVSDRSGVALATMYRYFGSRDLLAYVVGQEWATQVVADAHGRRWRSGDPIAGLIGQIRTSAKAMMEHPNLLETWAQASQSKDPTVTARVRDRIANESMAAMPLPEGVAADSWNVLLTYIDAVFYAGVIRWVHGHKPYAEIPLEVEQMVRLIAPSLDLPTTSASGPEGAHAAPKSRSRR